MSTQRALVTISEASTKERLPRKLKKQLSKQPKADPAGPPSSHQPHHSSSTPRAASRARSIEPARKRSTRRVNALATPKAVASLAAKLKCQDPTTYQKAQKRKIDADKLADKIMRGSFQATLAKYPGYKASELHQVMVAVIEHIRTPQPEPVPVKVEEAKPPRGLTAAQEAQRQEALRRRAMQTAPQPATKPPMAYTPPKGAPKVVARKVYTDLEIVTEALDELFQNDATLKMMFCRASNDAALRKLLATNAKIKRLTKALKAEGGVAAPSCLNYNLRTATKTLVTQYREESEVAERAAAETAAARREKEKQEAMALSAKKVEQLNRKKNRYNATMPRHLRKEISAA